MIKDIVPKEGNRFKNHFDPLTSKEGKSPVTFRSTEITAHEYLDFSLFRLVPPHLVDPGTIVVKTVRQPSVLEEHNYHKRPIIKTLVRKRLYWLRPPSPTFADSDQSQNNESSTESAKKFREEAVAAEERPRAES
ncbi:hypothetical protein niasHT_022238 [Heterodera trifolii]|uniref:Uncharacterized protein n=1 Tax=Heterodera trifolii TaxID=157864 RepID=A0ABD2JWQ4_9BILA